MYAIVNLKIKLSSIQWHRVNIPIPKRRNGHDKERLVQNMIQTQQLLHLHVSHLELVMTSFADKGLVETHCSKSAAYSSLSGLLQLDA